MLAKGWTLGSAQGLKFMHGVIRLYHRPAVRLAEEVLGETGRIWSFRWCRTSTGRCAKVLRSALPAVPYVTILTDFADYPPHFWMEKQDAVPDLRHRQGRGTGARPGSCR